MSVYTTVQDDQLKAFLTRYDLGEMTAFEPIEAGITNSNYFLDTTRGRYVLTLYEHHSDDELEYILGLQRQLAQGSVRCSQPIGDRRGDFFSSLNQRPAAISARLAGAVCPEPSLDQLGSIARELARFHCVGADFSGDRPNPRGVDWIVAATDMLREHLDDTDQLAIATSLRAARDMDLDRLPRGAIHADLFHDNALYDGDSLIGILDFDYACTDCFVFDIAVLMNDWCIDNNGALIDERIATVLDAYQGIRNLNGAEIKALPLMLRLSALRFWLSRLYDKAFPLSGQLTFIKDPESFRRMHAHRSNAALLSPLLNG